MVVLLLQWRTHSREKNLDTNEFQQGQTMPTIRGIP